MFCTLTKYWEKLQCNGIMLLLIFIAHSKVLFVLHVDFILLTVHTLYITFSIYVGNEASLNCQHLSSVTLSEQKSRPIEKISSTVNCCFVSMLQIFISATCQTKTIFLIDSIEL